MSAHNTLAELSQALSLGASGEMVLQLKDNLANALEIKNGSTSLFKAVTTDAADKIEIPTLTTTTLVLTTGTITTANVGDIAFAAAGDIDIPANTAAALEIDDGTTKIVAVDTRNTLKDISSVTITGVPVTVASEAAAHINASLRVAAKTITYSGTTGTTSSLGAGIHVGAMTWTDASAMTLTTASAVHIVAIAAAGGMLTITNSYMISTSVAGAFLTNAGVWTDMACWESGKEFVERGMDAASKAIENVLEQIIPATWKYKAETALPTIDGGVHRTPIDDMGRERVGIIYDDLPEALRCPGEKSAVAPGVLASFALAAIKHLWAKNQALEARLAAANL